MPNYGLALPKRRPSMNFEEGFEDMPAAGGGMDPAFADQVAAARARGQAHLAGRQAMAPAAAGRGASGASAGLAAAGTLFDMWGQLEENGRQDRLEDRAVAAYIRERDQEAEDRRKRDQLQQISTAFDFGNYAGNLRKGVGGEYGDYYERIGL